VAVVLSRRDRVRAATVAEIKDTARRILVADGVDGLSLRAIARDMGMTAPALYRYFPSREDLVTALIADLYDELVAVMVAAQEESAGRDDHPGMTEPMRRLGGASRGFRRWALANKREFALVFGSPIPGVGVERAHDDDPAHQAADRFGDVFGGLVARIYLDRPFPVPAEEELPEALRVPLAEWCGNLPVELPLGAAQVFLSCWIRLYGAVAMEVFGHLDFALTDAEPLFELELRDLAVKLGYRPPAPA
jgi:AcrR family transcriptional regulator